MTQPGSQVCAHLLPLREKSRARRVSLGRAVRPRGGARGDVVNLPLFLSSVSRPLFPFCSGALERLHWKPRLPQRLSRLRVIVSDSLRSPGSPRLWLRGTGASSKATFYSQDWSLCLLPDERVGKASGSFDIWFYIPTSSI